MKLPSTIWIFLFLPMAFAAAQQLTIPGAVEFGSYPGGGRGGPVCYFRFKAVNETQESSLSEVFDISTEEEPMPPVSINQVSDYSPEVISDFSRKLEAVGRILETEDFFVWGCSPIYGEDGKVHVFYSRWPKKYGMGGWIHKSEIAHAVANSPEGPYTYLETVLSSRPGHFDSRVR
jgi:hypothetical protein